MAHLLRCLYEVVSKTRQLGSEPKLQTERQQSSEYSKSIISRAFFTWALRIIRIANFRRLHIEDFEYVNPERTVAAKHAAFQKTWATQTKSPGAEIPLIWALLITYRREILFSAFMCGISISGKFATVVIYKVLLKFLQESHEDYDGHHPPFSKGVGLLFGTASAMFACAVITTHYMTSMSLLGGEIKTLLGSLMFEKSFVLSPLATRSRQKTQSQSTETAKDLDGVAWTQGTIINSMNSNTDRIEASVHTMSHLIALLPTIPLTIGLGWWLLGWAGIAGMLSGFVLLPGLLLLLSPISKLRQRINALTEERVDLVNDIVRAVRFIKYCAWEDIFSQKFESTRRREIAANARFIRGSLWVNVIVGNIASNAPNLVATAIYTHFHTGNFTLVVLPYFYLALLFRRFVGYKVAVAIVDAVNAYNALLDIQAFLLAEEETPDNLNIKPDLHQAVILDKARFAWTKSINHDSQALEPSNKDLSALEKAASAESLRQQHTKFELQPVNLEIGTNELVAIVGQVGSGKSSLAAALVGDMSHMDGSMFLRSKPSYCPQTPWIQNATIKDNIIFGQRYDLGLYTKVVHACALEQDLLDLPDGDRTILGELGVTISGGQKQRIQLARTLYQTRDIVILDDPLSAVDAYTSDHIFHHAIQTLLANKCCILITQQLHVLARCSKVIWLDNGTIKASGTMDELTEVPQFVQFLGNCKQGQALDDIRIEANEKDANTEPDLSSQLQLMQDEEVKAGRLQWREYWYLIRLSSPPLLILGIFVLLAMNGVATVVFSLSITWWAKGGGYHGLTPTSVGIICCMSIFSTWLSESTYEYIVQMAVLKSSSILSITALNRLLSATMTVFDTTPLGRILNVFTSDLNALDTQLPANLAKLVFYNLLLTAYLSLTVIIVPLIASIFIPWVLAASWIIFFYKSAPLQIKRLDRTYASLYTSKLTEGIIGRSSIKCCERESDFIHSLRSSIDDLNSVHFTGYACEAWVSVAQSVVSLFLYLFAGFIVLIRRHSLNPGLGFIVITSAEDLNFFIQMILTELTNVQRGMASVGRVRYYGESLDQEPPHYLPDFDSSKTWPKKGSISFANVSMRYRPDLPLAIQSLDLEIEGGQRIGIVGRTGAGKSSILAMLIRSVELAGGKIIIDGVDISTIGIHDLRKSIAVIPQDPTLFKGTIRSNLTPHSPSRENDRQKDCSETTQDEPMVSDEILLDALVKSSLLPARADPSFDITQEKPSSPSYTYGRTHLLSLDSPVLSGGSNLSHGERQLVMIARAIVRNASIVLCDEATSAVDPETDSRVQKSMRVGFADKTVISIAHRISTIALFDKVAVLDAGRLAEFGPPRELYKQSGSLFRALCEKSDVTYEDMSGDSVQ